MSYGTSGYNDGGFESVLSGMMSLVVLGHKLNKRKQQQGDSYISHEVMEVKLKPQKQGRNESCLCGSGKKYKNCCRII